VRGQRHARPLFTPGDDTVPIVQEAGWAPGPVSTGLENLVPPGLDPRTVQPVASRYTDWATPPTQHNEDIFKKIIFSKIFLFYRIGVHVTYFIVLQINRVRKDIHCPLQL